MGNYETIFLLGVILACAYITESRMAPTIAKPTVSTSLKPTVKTTVKTTVTPTTPPPRRWVPPRDPPMFKGGETNTIYTTQMSPAIYLMEDRNGITFRVKACSEVIISIDGISLSTHEGAQTEVVIGWNNSKTYFVHQSHIFATTPTPEILHCHEFRAFWMRWRIGLLELGRGPVVGRNTFLGSYELILVATTVAVVLAPSRHEETAVWQIRENTGDELLLETSPIYGYEKLWKSVQDRNFISFRVTACSDANIILSPRHGSVTDKVYEVVLGGKGNSESLIRTQAAGGEDSVIVSALKDDVLNCKESREFWIGWMNHAGGMGTLQVGHGHLYGSRVLMKMTDPTRTVNIRHLAISTGNGQIGAWSFDDDLGDMTTFKTETAKDAKLEDRYKNAWVRSPIKHFMVFFVTACSDAYVHLSSSGGVDEEFGVELIIGQEGKTILRPTAEVGNLAEVDTPSILSCDKVRYFWLSWKDGFIRFGLGRSYDTQLVLEAQAPANDYRAISFTTVGTFGTWRIKDSAGENLLFKDKPFSPEPFRPTVWRTVMARKRLSFRTDACSDVTVMLSPTPGVDGQSFYYLLQLSLIQDTYSTIRLCENNEKTCVTLANDTLADTRSCGTWREFYITWYDGRLMVGRGRFPTLLSSLLEADSSSIAHHVRAVAMSTSEGRNVSWTFREDAGDRFIYHTATKLNFQTWISLWPGMTYFEFEVKACSNAYVRLIPGPIESETPYLEIAISSGENQETNIRDNTGMSGDGVTGSFLDCTNSRAFWIYWDSTGLIQVKGPILWSSLCAERSEAFAVQKTPHDGAAPIHWGGHVVWGVLGGGAPLLEATLITSWMNPKPFNVSAIGISTGEGAAGLWSINENMGSWTYFPTHIAIIPLNMQETWRTVAHTRSIVFKVQAAAEVHVELSEELGVTTKNALEVFLGSQENTISLIRRPSSDTNWVTANTPGILDKDSFRHFWISWSEGEVQVGRGDIQGEDRFLQYQHIRELNFRGVRFSNTYNDETGSWGLPLWDGLAPIVPMKRKKMI